MTQFNFGYTISAQDRSAGGLRSAQSALQRFRATVTKPFQIAFNVSRRSLGLARDLRLTFSGLASRVKDAIEEGSNLEVVQKSFQKLTGTSRKDAEQLARFIQKSSNGTLTLAASMRLANRAITGGLHAVRQLPVVLDFISKRSIATGKDAGQALETVITGLSRGSTLFLDDFGILVDGVDGVKRSFDAIKGAGAFDALSPAAQKAETVRQAIEEMSQQQRRMGISGREQAFQLQGMSNAIRDSVSSLIQAVSHSRELNDFITNTAATIRGLSNHLRSNGGSIFDFFTGKSGGSGSGLFGVFTSFFKDVGAAMGEGLIDSVRKSLAGTPIERFIQKSSTPAPTSTAAAKGALFGDVPAGSKPSSGASNGGGIFQRTRKAIEALRDDFFGASGDGADDGPPLLFDPNDIKLTERGKRDRQLQINLINREIRKRAVFASREARRRAAQEVRDLRKRGIVGDRDLIEKRLRDDLTERATRGLEDRKGRITGELDQNKRREEIEKRFRNSQTKELREQTDHLKVIREATQAMAGFIGPNAVGLIAELSNRLAGAERRLAAARR